MTSEEFIKAVDKLVEEWRLTDDVDLLDAETVLNRIESMLEEVDILAS